MSLVLNGASYLSGGVGGLPIAAPLTIAYWAKASVMTDSWIVNLSKSSQNFVDVLTGLRTGGVAGMLVRQGASAPFADSAGSYSVGEWVHVTAIADSVSAKRTVLNGAVGATLAHTASPSGLDRFVIGAIVRPGLVVTFTGSVAEVGVWSRALSDSEIAGLAAGVRPSVYSAGLAGYYPLLSDAAATLGPTLSPSGSPAYNAADHPAVFEGAARVMDAQAASAGVEAGAAVVGGAIVGAATISGEVF